MHPFSLRAFQRHQKHDLKHSDFDELPNLFYRLKCESKMKTVEEQGVGARSLAPNTLGIEGRVGAPKWGLGKATSINYSHEPTQTKTSWLMHSLNTFGARTSHGQTWTHKTHHGLDLREATIFPFIVYSPPTSKWHFFLRLPSGNPEIPKVRTLVTLGPHNFVFRPPIEMKFETKL